LPLAGQGKQRILVNAVHHRHQETARKISENILFSLCGMRLRQRRARKCNQNIKRSKLPRTGMALVPRGGEPNQTEL
jgi:hypothetical protein